MKLDIKKVVTSSGLGKNIMTAARGLLDDNIKEFTVSSGTTEVPENSKGTVKVNLELDVAIGDITGHLDLKDLVISIQ